MQQEGLLRCAWQIIECPLLLLRGIGLESRSALATCD